MADRPDQPEHPERLIPRPEQTFPRLSDAQIDRMARVGRRRAVEAGEILYEPGDQNNNLYLVLAGALELERPMGAEAVATHVATLGPGQFTGEINMLSARRSIARARITAAGSVLAVDRESLHALIQRDAELSEILMRAFILRRVELIAQGGGDLVLLGSHHSAATQRLREFLTRNAHPFTFADIETHGGVQDLLDRFQVKPDEVPVVICKGGKILRNPTPEAIAVVGGGNSAGQAAVFLSTVARQVHVLVRGPGLAASMSKYLIERISSTPNVTLRTRTEVEALEGDPDLERVRWRHAANGAETRNVTNLFVMTGADPNSEWLAGCVLLDGKRFVKTGAELSAEDLAAAKWPLARRPMLMETSIPAVFAVGDLRAESVKRVASAVGEGSICVQLVHRALAEA